MGYNNDATDIKEIREFCGHLYAAKFENLRWNGHIPRRIKLIKIDWRIKFKKKFD